VSIQKQAQQTDSGRIVVFPGGASLGSKRAKERLKPATGEVEDLRKYESDAEPDDYRRRMIINVIAFTFIVLLTIAGMPNSATERIRDGMTRKTAPTP